MPKRARPRLTHLDARGRARMVDVGAKTASVREARAEATVHMLPATFRALAAGTAKKGDVLAAARLAGIQAAKRTPELIPLCHAIALSAVEVEIEPLASRAGVRIETRARATDRTGVEMEALTAAAVASLTVYDMLKAVDRGMHIEGLRLLSKRGGKSGDYERGPG